ncbi:SCO family protein [Marinobacter salicampi]|uniref:SCO family protein n=1 Tax=Marinobacter salicampi TaxID=435907 RepID=UPI00140E4AE5|nr:SCO family protein [Marinobacter salicampi]
MNAGPVLLLILVLLAPVQVGAETSGQKLATAGFEQRIGDTVEVQGTFTDIAGEPVLIADLARQRPLILVLSWFECPDLCPMVLDDLAEALAGLDFDHRDFDVAVVSIDPDEGPAEASTLKEGLSSHYKDGIENWRFLSGSQEAIRSLADAIGYSYAYDAERDRYAHPAGVVVLSPGNVISHYLLRLAQRSPDLRLALVDASRGELGSTADQVLLRCYRFDPDAGQYNLAVSRMMQMAGGASALALGLLVFWLRKREAR